MKQSLFLMNVEKQPNLYWLYNLKFKLIITKNLIKLNIFNQKDFILIASDTITDINLDDLTDEHLLRNASISIVYKSDKVEETPDGPKILNPSSFEVKLKKK